MTIDKLFEECILISDIYEINLICVLDRYTTIEQENKRNNKPYDLKNVIIETEKYFKENKK